MSPQSMKYGHQWQVNLPGKSFIPFANRLEGTVFRWPVSARLMTITASICTCMP